MVDVRRRALVRGTLLAFVAFALATICYLIAITPPTRDSWYPKKCVHYQVTGMHCPGCGTGRALHFALNGELGRAAGYNLFSLITIPVVLIINMPALVRWVRSRPRPLGRALSAYWIWLIFAFIVAFWICRNIPV